MTIRLLLPFDERRLRQAGAPQVGVQGETAAVNLPHNAVLGLIVNGKTKADVLLEAVARNLKQRGVIADYFMHSKKPSDSISDSQRDALVDRADLVISGVGDCGGCTALSTSDAIRCLMKGVPAFVIATTKFAFLVEAADREYGVAGLARLFVEHPVWSRSDAWLEAEAARLTDRIVAGVSVAGQCEPFVSADVEATIPDALADLREGMSADGYDMTSVMDEGRLTISVTKRPGAGEACLIPQEQFERLVSGMLANKGMALAPEALRVTYPGA